MQRRLRYGLLAGCLGLIALHARDGARAWNGGAPALVGSEVSEWAQELRPGTTAERRVASGIADPDPFGNSQAESDTVAVDSLRPWRSEAPRVARANDPAPVTAAQASR